MNSANELLEIEVLWTDDLRLVIQPPGATEPTQNPPRETLEIEIPRGASVRWNFTGLLEQFPDNWTPNILFSGGSPFGTLTRTSTTVEAADNSGTAGSFRFVAVLQDNRAPRLSRVFSAPTILWQEAVSVDVEVDIEQRTFSIHPTECRIVEGMSVLWRFHGVPDGHQEQLIFTDYQPLGSTDRLYVDNFFGPFAAISRRTDGLLGTGASGLKGKFNYRVQLLSGEFGESHIVLRELHSVDPVVDNEKDPPEPITAAP